MLTDAGGRASRHRPAARAPRSRRSRARRAWQSVLAAERQRDRRRGRASRITATTAPADPVTSDLVTRLRTERDPGRHPRAGRDRLRRRHHGGLRRPRDIISYRLPLVIGVVLALSFVVLLVAFRSVLVPLKAILCNLLAVGASFGILTAFFQWGWGLELVGLEIAVRHRADRQLRAAHHVRGAVRHVDGLRGVPDQPDLPRAQRGHGHATRRCARAWAAARASSPPRRSSWSPCS